MTGSKLYKTLMTVLLAVLGLEVGTYLAGTYFVPAVNDAIQSSAPAMWQYWVANGLVHVGSALAVAGLAVAAGWRLSRVKAPPPPSSPAPSILRSYPVSAFRRELSVVI